jgi:cytochrome b
MNQIPSTMLVPVWDIPVRLFHWLLVLLVVVLFVTGKLGGNWLEWHRRAGFSVLGLVTFRILWGFVGSHHARFATFARGPIAVLEYVKSVKHKNSPRYAGHNPLGALSVVAMVIALLAQAVLGLFSNDDLMLEGPYASMVSKAISDFCTTLHKLNSDFLLILIGIHLAAIAFAYFYKRENLLKPMFTGKKKLPAGAIGAAHSPSRPAWLAWVIGACVAMGTYAILNK